MSHGITLLYCLVVLDSRSLFILCRVWPRVPFFLVACACTLYSSVVFNRPHHHRVNTITFFQNHLNRKRRETRRTSFCSHSFPHHYCCLASIKILISKRTDPATSDGHHKTLEREKKETREQRILTHNNFRLSSRVRSEKSDIKSKHQVRVPTPNTNVNTDEHHTVVAIVEREYKIVLNRDTFSDM